MKNLNLLIIMLLTPLTYQCAADVEHTDIEPTTETTTITTTNDGETVIDVDLDIDLGAITNRYINLSAYQGETVHIGGQYSGDRVVLQNTSDMAIVKDNFHI